MVPPGPRSNRRARGRERSGQAAGTGEPADAALEAELTIVCRQVVELVTDYLEGALPGELRDAVERHLAVCPPCVVYVEQMRTTAAALAGRSRRVHRPPHPC